mgnify:CR=1 FL=1
MKDSLISAKLRHLITGPVPAMMLLGLTVTACGSIVDHRGYVMSDDRINQVDVGASKEQVQTALGSPSATSTIEGTGGLTYYYISSKLEQKLFFAPKVTDRTILAIDFDDKETVTKVAKYGLKDGVIFDFISRKTPTRGKKLTFLQQMFGNIGRFNSKGGGLFPQRKQ